MVKKLLVFMGVTACLIVAIGFIAEPVQAQVQVFDACNNGQAGGTAVCQGTSNGINTLFGGDSLWSRILRILTIVIGAVSVLMVVIGGFRYVISGGDSSATKSAKDTILYALIGLVVAIMANTIINFIINNI